VHWGCNHCGWTGPEKGTGKSNGQDGAIVATYDYHDVDGVLCFQKVRYAKGHKPPFSMRRPDGRGGWIWNTEGVDTKIIYRADEVAKAIAEGRIIAAAEGEKDADNLWARGIAATCNAHGASDPGKKPKWTKAHSEQLRGANLVVFNDNDAAGYEHADVTVRLSLGIARRVRRLDLKPLWPDMPKGSDISDWLATGHTREELDALIAAAPVIEAPPGPREESAPTDAEITRLAKLTAVQYEQERKAVADRRNVRASILDRLVRDERTRLGLDNDNGKQGHAISFPEPELWPESVDGAALLDRLRMLLALMLLCPIMTVMLRRCGLCIAICSTTFSSHRASVYVPRRRDAPRLCCLMCSHP